MSELAIWVVLLTVSPAVCALIAQARGIEWWVGALLGLLGCIGLVLVFFIKPHRNAAAVPPPPPNAQWAADPTGRHELRLFDGRQWTANVSDRGISGWDPLQ